MNRVWRRARYVSKVTHNDEEGWSSIDVCSGSESAEFDSMVLVFRIVYWDAEGQFFLEQVMGEIPFEVLEGAMR